MSNNDRTEETFNLFFEVFGTEMCEACMTRHII